MAEKTKGDVGAPSVSDLAAHINAAFGADLGYSDHVLELIAAGDYREAFLTWMDEQAKGKPDVWFTLLLIVGYQVSEGSWAALVGPGDHKDG